jgi:hypothetical protein
MRLMIAAAAIAALTLAACSQGADKAEGETAGAAGAAAPAASMEGPRPGLWRVTTAMAGMPGGAAMAPVETCITSSTFEAPGGTSATPGAECTTQPFRRDGDAMVSSTVCQMQGGMKSESNIRVSGDFSSRYTMEVKSKTTGAPAAIPETTMTMTAERLGDCPGA